MELHIRQKDHMRWLCSVRKSWFGRIRLRIAPGAAPMLMLCHFEAMTFLQNSVSSEPRSDRWIRSSVAGESSHKSLRRLAGRNAGSAEDDDDVGARWVPQRHEDSTVWLCFASDQQSPLIRVIASHLHKRIGSVLVALPCGVKMGGLRSKPNYGDRD